MHEEVVVTEEYHDIQYRNAIYSNSIVTTIHKILPLVFIKSCYNGCQGIVLACLYGEILGVKGRFDKEG